MLKHHLLRIVSGSALTRSVRIILIAGCTSDTKFTTEALSLISAVCRPERSREYKKMPSETSFEEVNKALAANAIIYVDVRNPVELIDDGKIAGSVNLPLPEIQEGLALSPADFELKYGFPKPDLSANLVVGCRSGKRASTAANALEALGYSNIKYYCKLKNNYNSNHSLGFIPGASWTGKRKEDLWTRKKS